MPSCGWPSWARRWCVTSILTALWPASAYGAGLRRAFVGLSPTREEELPGLQGRALMVFVLLPILVVGSLLGSVVVPVALWLYWVNILLLVGYRAARA